MVNGTEAPRRGATRGRFLLLGLVLAGTVSVGRAGAQAAPNCSDCHEVDKAAFEKTVHGSFACTDCHVGAAKEEHDAKSAKADCSSCHGDVQESIAASIHGKPEFTALSGLDRCGSCHGKIHALAPRSSPASAVNPVKLPETCGQCHSSPEMAQKFGFRVVQPLAAYQASVHHRAIEEGKAAATCSSCHGAHDILPAADPKSRVNHSRVPQVCGQCHGEITKKYQESVHGVAAAAGIREAPVCTDCHGEHRIIGPREEGSPVSASNVPKMTCERCHADLRMTEKFGLKTDAVAAFRDSFHGLANQTGNATAANCASCHGVHDIQPSTDPRSHVNAKNLPATCGACHPGAGQSFAIGPVHVLPQDKAAAHPAVYWVREGYVWLIWLTIGGMFLHNFLDLRRKVLSPVARPMIPQQERRERLNKGFRIAHFATAVSFIVLVYTGFALKYPEGWWAAPLLAWEGTFEVRAWLHRIAALVMIAAFLFHFVHIAIDRRARACIKAMLPTFHDLDELRERIRWYFGKRKEMPHAPPLGYIEKAEYLALIWGTIVMAVTGALLWFENFTLSNFPKWVSDLATVIHFYEAILATLAILVWHFYWVLFDPLVYPMDTAWFNGKEVPGRTLERKQSVVEPKEKKG